MNPPLLGDRSAETTDLKRKWKEALARVDMLGQSISEATQPLLRQIHALQEEQRSRQDAWKATEPSLREQLYTLVNGVTGDVNGDISLERLPSVDALLELTRCPSPSLARP
ncbi:hypothetical protein DVH05_006794 [Phytophthora capsici]|nr:hypothetical protein DVH05_006794 [Phytophthora capsici]